MSWGWGGCRATVALVLALAACAAPAIAGAAPAIEEGEASWLGPRFARAVAELARILHSENVAHARAGKARQ